MKNPPKSLKISSHVFKVSEHQLEFLLYDHFLHKQPFFASWRVRKKMIDNFINELKKLGL